MNLFLRTLVARPSKLLISGAVSTALFIAIAPTPARGAETLDQSFKSPPNSARPFTWWHWLNDNVTKEGITKDLEAMKAAGIGGYQQFSIGLAGPVGQAAYNSPQFHELTAFAFSEAARLGLDAGFSNAAGWSSTGGPWITAENSMKKLTWSEAKLSGGTPSAIQLKAPETNNDFYRDVAVLAFPTPKDDKFRIKDWQGKSLADPKARANVFIPDTRQAPEEAVIPASKVVVLNDHMDAKGNLSWTPPTGDWTVVRIGYTSTGVTNHPKSGTGIGLEVDKLSRKALDAHWDALITKVVADAKSKGKSPLTTFLIDSYEVGNQNWTESLPQEFKKRRGYELTPLLPRWLLAAPTFRGTLWWGQNRSPK